MEIEGVGVIELHQNNKYDCISKNFCKGLQIDLVLLCCTRTIGRPIFQSFVGKRGLLFVFRGIVNLERLEEFPFVLPSVFRYIGLFCLHYLSAIMYSYALIIFDAFDSALKKNS